VLSLSRLLSKRLRTKEHPGVAGEATVIAIASAARGRLRVPKVVVLGVAERPNLIALDTLAG